MTHTTTFYPRGDGKANCVRDTEQPASSEPFSVVLFTATPANDLWLGEAPLEDIARQCVECVGRTGHNVEYVLKLAEWARETFPEVEDKHLYGLEVCTGGSQVR